MQVYRPQQAVHAGMTLTLSKTVFKIRGHMKLAKLQIFLRIPVDLLRNRRGRDDRQPPSGAIFITLVFYYGRPVYSRCGHYI